MSLCHQAQLQLATNKMQPLEKHLLKFDVSFDGGDLDCGNGLLLLIRKHIDPLERGQLLEILSTDLSVREDLPAWCRMTENELISIVKNKNQFSYLVAKGKLSDRVTSSETKIYVSQVSQVLTPVIILDPLPNPVSVPLIAPLSVMGVGSWPRPRWMLDAIHNSMEKKIDEQTFQATADDAVRLAVAAQLRAGVDVVTDGEQRRDSYASFVGGILDNCQLIPLTDLLPFVDDPEEFERELRALDIPASDVRHPAVFGPLGRSKPLAVHEHTFLKTLTDKPTKVALPGPYLLTRTMWLECVSDRTYKTREHLATDIVRILREEIACLLAAGVALVQLDEPVLSEVVFSGGTNRRSFMCGALGEKEKPEIELAFARDLINSVTKGFPQERIALHMCRGNWSTDESVALSGSYASLTPTLAKLNVGILLLELCTPRSGEMEILKKIPDHIRIAVGVCNQKHTHIESVDEIVAKGSRAISLFGAERVLFCPDCGFATFADNPISTAVIAEQKLKAISEAAQILRKRNNSNI